MSELLQQLSTEFSLPMHDLIYLIRSAPYRYKVYEIDKKTPGQKRTIAQPARELKPLQRWVIQNVLAEFPIHESAMAYRKNWNILDNASRHARQRYLCKLDFKNFFPSIKAADFELFMRSASSAHPWTEEEIGYLSRILFWCKKRGKSFELSIGAPSSPMVSNILLYGFDLAIGTLCTQTDVVYTRYADDLTFSTNRPGVLQRIEIQIPKICTSLKSPRLLLNRQKTVYASKRGSRRVTGLVLTNDGLVSIGRNKKRIIRATIHKYMSGGLADNEAASLAGTLAFINSVEPSFLRRLSGQYGSAVIRDLLARRGSSE
jgi:retron-type reverse transcriptase